MQAKNFLMLSCLLLFFMNSALVSGSIPNLLNKNKSQMKNDDQVIDNMLKDAQAMVQEESTDSKWSKRSQIVLEDEDENDELLEVGSDETSKNNKTTNTKNILNLVQNSINLANKAEKYSSNQNNDNEEIVENEEDEFVEQKSSTNLFEDTLKLAESISSNMQDSNEVKQMELLQLKNNDSIEDDEISSDQALIQAGEENEDEDNNNTNLLQTVESIIDQSSDESNKQTLLEETMQKSGVSKNEDESDEFVEEKTEKVDVGKTTEELANSILIQTSEEMESKLKTNEKEGEEENDSEYFNSEAEKN